MINKKEFHNIRKDLENFEEKREQVIQLSREIITLSKQIIYSIHRDELNLVPPLITKIKAKVKSLPPSHHDTDIYKVALQEYAEALAYYHFVKDKKLVLRKELGLDSECYLLGLCDFTGELVRKATTHIIQGNTKEAEEIRRFVEDLYGEFIKFNFRNGDLRKKTDMLRGNLRRLEEIMVNVKLRG
ncbi:MAG: hypothetical protein HYS32_00620 [Candidatus Woesearchaeota archaeon]|nr:MAG: hypothetical protein HYS32_00620 [Candidatus Woesearchaeota archaeon]